MVRMANWRRNRIVEARLAIMLLVTERTREGDVMRRQIDLPLVRERTSVFFLTWTAMHRIDENSPFFGPDALERLRAQQAELYLALTGLDETIGQTIHARTRYTPRRHRGRTRASPTCCRRGGRHARHRLPQVPRRRDAGTSAD